MKQKGKTWIDSKRKYIPLYAVTPTQKAEEKLSQRFLRMSLTAENSLEKLVKEVRKAYAEILELKIKEANFKGHKPPSGSITINSFDNTIEVKITKPDNLYFDETYTNMVKVKFSDYFKSFGNDNDQIVFLRDLVNDLLYTSGGRLDNSKVLKLRKHRNTFAKSKKLSKSGELFIEAVDLFDQAIKTKPGSTGIYVSYSPNPHDKKCKVSLKYTDI